MLLAIYTREQKLTSCKYTIYLLLEKINSIQQKQRVVSLLLLNVSKAFNNILHKRLLYNLYKHSLSLEIIYQITSYLQDKKSQIRLVKGISTKFLIYIGILQSLLLSLILYLFYNVDLLEISYKNNLLGRYINNIVILITSKLIELTIAKLIILYKRADL